MRRIQDPRRVHRVALFYGVAAVLFLTAGRAPREITILAIGDSTTSGTPFYKSSLESPPDGSGDPEAPYTYWMTRGHPLWKIVNAGIAGQRTDEIRVRYGETLSRHAPRYVVILAGINDIAQNGSGEEAARNLAWMYKEALGRHIIPVATTVLPFDRATADQNAEIEALNRWITDAAEKLRIPFADLHRAVADPDDRTKLSGSPDGLHPDLGGYRKMGKTLATIIAEMESERPR